MMRKPITPTAHGVIDYAYVAGLPMVGSRLDAGTQARRLLKTAAVTALTYSLFTKYKLALVPRLSMKTHVRLDLVNNGLLLAAPWLLRGERRSVLRAMVALGLSGLAVSLLTQTEDDTRTAESSWPDDVARTHAQVQAYVTPGAIGVL
jgi:hypothetical protein